MFRTDEYDPNATSVSFRATYVDMTTSYHCMPPLCPETRGFVSYLIMRDADGVCVDVPCTLLAAELIRHYESGTQLRLFIAPRVLHDYSDGHDELVPLCIGAVRAL